MITIRASSLQTYEECPRMFGVRFIQNNGLAADYDLELNKTKTGIGSIVGTASHAGVEYLMRELKRTGEWGGARRSKAAQELAANSVAEHPAKEVELDRTTRSKDEASWSAGSIVGLYHSTQLPEGEPHFIEEGFAVQYTDPVTGWEYRVSGTPDRFIVGGTLKDLKTSASLGNHYAQMGIYATLFEAHGYPVKRCVIEHIPRVSRGKPLTRDDHEIDLREAKVHSSAVLYAAQRDLALGVYEGDFETMLPRTSSNLCSRKFCPAYGTSACTMGALIHG